ncbi:MAG: restriction endonuclease subunit S [Nitrospirales bacterium]
MKRWPTKRLCDLAEVKAGFAWKAAAFSESEDAGPPVIRIQNLGSNDNAVFAYYSGDVEPGYWVEKGDLLVSLSGSFKVCQWDGPSALLNQRIVVIRPGAQLKRSFAFYQISERLREISQAAVGIAVANASMGTVRDMEFSVPPLAEQDRIVKLLDEADELRKLRAQADGRTAHLIPSLFHEMFDGIRGWPVERLEKLCERLTVGHVGPMATEYCEKGVPFLRGQNIKRGFIDLSTTLFVSEDFHRRLAKSAIAPGDVVSVRTGKPGTTAVVPPLLKVANCADLIVMTCGPRLIPEFLCELLNQRLGDKDKIAGARGIAQQHFNIGEARKLEMGVPPLALQKQFAARASEIRAVQAEQAASHRRFDDLFQSMLHRAFKGEL